MSRRLSASLLAAAVALSPMPLIATTAPAAAQLNVNVNIGFDYFYDQLSPYGDWSYHPRWGDVWRPRRVAADFRPYYRGYWVNTVEYGWTWETGDPWGGVPYHYGRWVYDPYDGWLWVPGYTWAPAWVVWREGGGNIGWFPMPPDDRFLAGYDVYREDWDWNRGYFGYSNWYGPTIVAGLTAAWTFVALDRFADRDYYRYARPRTQVVNIINNTTNVTNYVTVNNRVVNRSIDVAQVERASGRRIERVQARDVVRTPITTVATGQQVQVRERERHGGDVSAPARERVQALPPAEAKIPVRERRSVRFQRDQQTQQPNAQPVPGAPGAQPDIARPRDAERQQQQQQRNTEQQRAREDRATAQRDAEQRAAAQREQLRQQDAERQQRQRDVESQAQQRARDERAAIQRNNEVQQQRDRAAQAEAQRQQRAQAAQQDAERQNRARAEQQRAQAEQQQRGQAEQQQRAAAQREAERQQRAQAQQEQQATAQERQRARAQKQQEQPAAQPQEEERKGRGRDRN